MSCLHGKVKDLSLKNRTWMIVAYLEISPKIEKCLRHIHRHTLPRSTDQRGRRERLMVLEEEDGAPADRQTERCLLPCFRGRDCCFSYCDQGRRVI